MALTARAARRKIAKLLEALTEREPCQGEGRGFKSLFPLSNQELTASAECISKLMHFADALFEVCAPSDPKTLWPFGPLVFPIRQALGAAVAQPPRMLWSQFPIGNTVRLPLRERHAPMPSRARCQHF